MFKKIILKIKEYFLKKQEERKIKDFFKLLDQHKDIFERLKNK